MENYFARGRRKEATASVFLKEGKGDFHINKKKAHDYFLVNPFLANIASYPLKVFNVEKEYDTWVRVKGGGFNGQAEAIRLGVARVLLKKFPKYKKTLKSFSLLTCDSRRVERKKVGLKKARKAPQFSKR